MYFGIIIKYYYIKFHKIFIFTQPIANFFVNLFTKDDLVEIGVFGNGKEGIQNALYLKKQRIHSGANRIVVKMSKKPVEVGIDPRNLLIDTEIHDNVRQLIDEEI